MPTNVVQLRRVQDCLYDTAFLPENMGSRNVVHLFQIPLGAYAGRKIKEREHTNMLMAGCLPAPEEFGIRQIKCGFFQGGEQIEPLPGSLQLFRRLTIVSAFPLDQICDPHVRSLTYSERHDYGKGFLDLADQKTPIFCRLQTQEYFSCVLELERKPDIPTEFLAVLLGDHFIFTDEESERLPTRPPYTVPGKT